MKEEDFIREQAGKENPFKVPEGYFESLTKQVMNQLPDIPQAAPVTEPTSWQKIKPWLYMAAMFIAILLPVRLMMEHTDALSKKTAAQTEQNENYAEEYIEYAILDHTAMDDYSFYQYMYTEEDYSFENPVNDEEL